MNRIASAAAKNTIPLLFCLFLLLSLIRIRLGGLPSAPDAERTPEYIDGFVYDAILNKNGQLLFLPEAGDALLPFLYCAAAGKDRNTGPGHISSRDAFGRDNNRSGYGKQSRSF